jgi:hypothetical protein
MSIFEAPRRLFDQYFCKHLAAKTPGFDEHLAQEARVRLCQTQGLYDRILQLEQNMLDTELRATPPASDPTAVKFILHDLATPPCDQPAAPLRPFTRADELRILVEAFYYNASRVRDLFRDSQRGLPDLSSFEAKGVRDVRNHLVEHPTRQRGVRLMAIALGGDTGPRLKPMRRSQDSAGTIDPGLHKNAHAFCAALSATLSTALKAGAA